MPGYASISAEAAHFLVDQYPIDFVLIDVRRRDEVNNFGSIEYSYNIPVGEWEHAMDLSPTDFTTKYNFNKPTQMDNLIICSRTSKKRAIMAAEKAVQLGYKRVAVMKGGICEYSLYDPRVKFYESYSENQTPPQPTTPQTQKNQTNYPWITTEDLHKAGGKFLILDLRRKDELENFGTYPSAVHLPTEECLRASNITEEEWEKEYGFSKPHANQNVLLYCRSNRRAKYVYKVLRDAGWEKDGIYMHVFKDGVAGLSRLTDKVKAYEAYEVGDPISPVIPPVNPLYPREELYTRTM